MDFIFASWRNVIQHTTSDRFEESGIIASNEPGTDEESVAVDLENDNETVIFDFDEYIWENIAICETEKAIAPSVRPYGLFISWRRWTRKNRSSAHPFCQYCIEKLTNSGRLFSFL